MSKGGVGCVTFWPGRVLCDWFLDCSDWAIVLCWVRTLARLLEGRGLVVGAERAAVPAGASRSALGPAERGAFVRLRPVEEGRQVGGLDEAGTVGVVGPPCARARGWCAWPGIHRFRNDRRPNCALRNPRVSPLCDQQVPEYPRISSWP